jgi:outer membrane receptor protein involved in Fe transport
MRVNKVHAAVVAALTGASGLTYQAAFAQEGLEEIVVTATRREQNLQEVPISIVAITGENLETRSIDNLEEVSQSVPNVIITGGTGGTGGTSFRMRGIPNVGTYVDGIWQVGTAGFLTNEFVDIDRVEVLRGPQGTMFGRDSTGGAIRIWTQRPAEELGGNLTVTAGSMDRTDVKGSLDVPFGDNVRTKWTGANLSRDGYIYSQTTATYGGAVDQQVLRGDIVWDATDNLSFRFNYQNDQSSFTEPRVMDAMFRTFDDPNVRWVKSIIGTPELYTYVGTDFRGVAVEPMYVPALQVAGYPGGRVGKEQNRSNVSLPNRYDTEQLSIETNWQLTDNLSLQFLTAQTEQDADSVIEWDNSQYDLVTDINRSKLDVFSQEMQLTGDRDRFEWLAGAYYWDQQTNTRNGRWQVNEFQKGLMNPANVFANPVCNPQGAALEQTPATNDNPGNMRFVPGTSGLVTNGLYAGQTVNLGGVPLPPDANGVVNATGAWQTCQQIYYTAAGGAYDNIARNGQDGWAVFGEATVHLTDTLDLTLGVRQHDQSGYTVNMVAIPGVTATKPVDPIQYHNGNAFAGTDNAATYTPFEFDKLTSRFALQNQFTDNFMGYVSYSEGFNSGGVSTPTVGVTRLILPYKPSTLKNTEVGMRSDLADGMLRFNATLFHTIWDDLQATGVVYDPVTGVQIPTTVITNVGEAKAEGVEFELTILPTANIAVNVGLGFLDTAYTVIAEGTYAGHLPLTGDTDFEHAPEESYSLGFQHTASLGNGGTLVSRLDYNYQGSFWRSDPYRRVDGYQEIPDGFEESGDWGILNLRFAYEPADANYQIAVFGTNLTDEYTINSGFFHGIWGFDFATVGRPREAGASLTFRF